MNQVIIPRKGTFGGWEREKTRLGLRCRYATVDERLHVTMVLEPFSRDGQRVLFDDEVKQPPKKVNPMKPTQKTERPKAKLADMLSGLYQRADSNHGQVARIELKGGLRIDLIVGIDGMTRILLARRTVHPSPVEWRTTLANLPYNPPGEVTPEPFIHNGWGCYRAAWKTTAE